jgi:hypothetical protein
MLRYASRKFWLTVAVEGTAIIGLFTHFIDQQHFLWIATLTLGMYKAASVLDTKLNGDK